MLLSKVSAELMFQLFGEDLITAVEKYTAYGTGFSINGSFLEGLCSDLFLQDDKPISFDVLEFVSYAILSRKYPHKMPDLRNLLGKLGGWNKFTYLQQDALRNIVDIFLRHGSSLQTKYESSNMNS